MLFNILSVILVWIISVFVFAIAFRNDSEDNDFSAVCGGLGAITTIVFMWIMSLQNLWR